MGMLTKAELLAGGFVGALASTYRNWNQIVLMPCDSRAAQATLSAANGTTRRIGNTELKKAQSALVAGISQSGNRHEIVYNGGIASFGAIKSSTGSTDQSYLKWGSPDPRFPADMNNLEAALSTNAMWAYFAGGIANDVSQGVTADELKAVLFPMFDRFRLSGHRLLLQLEHGAPGLTPAQIRQLLIWNSYVRLYKLSNPATVHVIDAPGVLWDSTATSTAALTFLVGVTDNGPHHSNLGAWLVGALIAAELGATPALPYEPASAIEVFANTGTQFSQSPLFALLGAKPADANGITYTTAMPTGVTVERGLNGAAPAGAATVSIGLIDDPIIGRGKALKADIVSTQDLEYAQINFTQVLANTQTLTAKQVLRAGCRFSVAAGSANMGIPYHYARLTVDGAVNEATDLGNPTGTNLGAGPTFAYKGTHVTGRLTMPDAFTSVTLLFHRVVVPFIGAGGGSVIISNPWLRVVA